MSTQPPPIPDSNRIAEVPPPLPPEQQNKKSHLAKYGWLYAIGAALFLLWNHNNREIQQIKSQQYSICVRSLSGPYAEMSCRCMSQAYDRMHVWMSEKEVDQVIQETKAMCQRQISG